MIHVLEYINFAIIVQLSNNIHTGNIFTRCRKENNDFCRYFHRKINRWDACTSLLLVEKHQESLQDYERQPRKYFKKDQAFWCSGGKQEVAKKYPRISLCEIPAPQAPVNLSQQRPRTLEQSEEDLKWLKIIELIKLLTELLGNQLNVPKKPQKPDLLSQILNIAIPRQD